MMAVMEIFFFFFFYLFSFYLKASRVFRDIDCSDTGSWWKWPRDKLDLSTSYLCPLNITLEIYIFLLLSKWGDGKRGEKKDQWIFLFCCTHSAAGLSEMSSVADDSVVCPPTWCNTPQVHISLNSGFHGSLPKISFLLLFCCLSFVLKFIIHYK